MTKSKREDSQPEPSQEDHFSQLYESSIKKLKAAGNKDQRLKIIKALSSVDDPWVETLLLDSLNDPSNEIRDVIVRVLGKRNNLDLKQVHKKLSASPWFVKSDVIRILALHKDPSLINALNPLLKDPNIDVRITAVRALGEIGGNKAVSMLAEMTKEKNQFVRKEAERALSKTSSLKFS